MLQINDHCKICTKTYLFYLLKMNKERTYDGKNIDKKEAKTILTL